jgi:hypothetical protein
MCPGESGHHSKYGDGVAPWEMCFADAPDADTDQRFADEMPSVGVM